MSFCRGWTARISSARPLRWKLTPGGEPFELARAPSLREFAESESGPVAALFEAVAYPDRFSENLRPLIRKTKGELLKAREQARALLESIRLLKARLGRLGEAMNLQHLYDSNRRLFTIGYNVSRGLTIRPTTICWRVKPV